SAASSLRRFTARKRSSTRCFPSSWSRASSRSGRKTLTRSERGTGTTPPSAMPERNLRILRELNPHHYGGYGAMLSLVVTLLIIALIAAALGFGGIAGAAAGIAKIVFFVFIVLFLLSLLF